MTDRDHCPHCGTSLIGDPIPEAWREHVGDQTHYRREVAIYHELRDRTTHFACPDCGGFWERKDGA